MITENRYPILEFDDSGVAKLNPTTFVERPFDTDRMVITFFPEVIDRLREEGRIAHERTIGGENPVEIYRFEDADVLITLGQVGCPACAGNLDLFNAMGITRAMFCGGGGVLDRNIEVGQILVVDGAIRDEGFSYHYFAPARCIYTEPEVTDRIARRRDEGAKIVEMEQAGCIAVARFRGFAYGALIYGGDDVSQEEWSNRSWRSRKGIRYDLVTLCKRLVEMI